MEYIQTKYTVTFSTSKDTDKDVSITWENEAGELDRIGGPAYEEFDPVTGNKVKEIYAQLGKRHRDSDEGPAVRKWNPQGRLVMEGYYQWDKEHRKHRQPAIIEYDPETGEVAKKKYYNLGRQYNLGRKFNATATASTEKFEPSSDSNSSKSLNGKTPVIDKVSGPS